jgi:hypothetical protein
MIIQHAHYSRVNIGEWRWSNFQPHELASKREGAFLIDTDALDKLQVLREAVGKPMTVVSAYRSPAHNKAVGGAKNSYHMKGMAFDIAMHNHDPHEFERLARRVGFTGFGFYPQQGFMHIDIGPAREWGPRWKNTMPPKKADPKPGTNGPTLLEALFGAILALFRR